MGEKPRWIPWALAGCGTVSFGVAAVVVGALLFSAWCAPSPRETPSASSFTRAPSPFALDTEGFDSVEDIVRDRNDRLVRREREVYSGALDHERDTEIQCSPQLSISVPARTFSRPETVSVKALTLSSDFVASTPLAAYEVTIGKGGPLRRPVTLTFAHKAVPEEQTLVAGRWDEERTEWTEVPLMRKSATESVVQADHLSTYGIFPVVPGPRYLVHQSRDSHFKIILPGDASPNLDPLFARRGDTGSVGERYRARNTRLERALDDGGFTDMSQPRSRRYTADSRRRLCAAILERMLSRIWDAYEREGYKPPSFVRIDVNTHAAHPNWAPMSAGHTIQIPLLELTDIDTLAANLGHEMFHACQNNSGLSAPWMSWNRWLTEASAEYAASRVAWGDLGDRPFNELGVVLSKKAVWSTMGDTFSPAFLERPLASIKRALKKPGRAQREEDEHPYESAHFLDFLFDHGPANFKGLWSQIHASGVTDRNESILQQYCAKTGGSLSAAYEDFAAHVVLDESFGPPGGDPEKDKRELPVMLDSSSPVWTQKLFTFGDFSGDYVGFKPNPLPSESGEPRTLTLTFTASGGRAAVRVYRAPEDRLDVSATTPFERVEVSDQRVVIVPFTAREQVWVVASDGDSGCQKLDLHAELTAGLTITGKPRNDGTWRLEVQTPEPLEGRVRYLWQLKDPDGPRLVETREATVDHAYSRPGEYEVQATLVDEDDEGQKVAEAVGVVTVTSALRLTILDARTRRPVPGARVSVRAGDWKSRGRADGAGVATAEPMPPFRSQVTVTVEADGYEKFSKTAAVDLTEARLVRRQIHLEPKAPPKRVGDKTPKAAPPSTRRPPPPPRAEPTPRPTPHATPTPVPAPAPEPTYDDGAGLAAWKAAWAAAATGSDSSSACDSLSRCQCRYTHEWTVAPYLEGGDVMGASTKFLDKTCEDGRVLQHFPVAVQGEAGHPSPLTTIGRIRKEYPQFWRR